MTFLELKTGIFKVIFAVSIMKKLEDNSAYRHRDDVAIKILMDWEWYTISGLSGTCIDYNKLGLIEFTAAGRKALEEGKVQLIDRRHRCAAVTELARKNEEKLAKLTAKEEPNLSEQEEIDRLRALIAQLTTWPVMILNNGKSYSPAYQRLTYAHRLYQNSSYKQPIPF